MQKDEKTANEKEEDGSRKRALPLGSKRLKIEEDEDLCLNVSFKTF